MCIQKLPDPSKDYIFWQNITLGIFGNSLLVLILEAINYHNTKQDLIFQYVNEAQKIYNSLLKVRMQSGKTAINSEDIILDLQTLDFTHLFNTYNGLSFFITWDKFNKYKPRINAIQNSLYVMHEKITGFSTIYPVFSGDENEKKKLLKNYRNSDSKELYEAIKNLEALKGLINKRYHPRIIQ